MEKVWFITGAGSGMGNATANEVLKAGDCVVATTRKEHGFTIPAGFEEKALCLKLDISE